MFGKWLICCPATKINLGGQRKQLQANWTNIVVININSVTDHFFNLLIIVVSEASFYQQCVSMLLKRTSCVVTQVPTLLVQPKKWGRNLSACITCMATGTKNLKLPVRACEWCLSEASFYQQCVRMLLKRTRWCNRCFLHVCACTCQYNFTHTGVHEWITGVCRAWRRVLGLWQSYGGPEV